jgi:hypothetical protein
VKKNKMTPLMFALRVAKKRNDGAYLIIGLMSGFGEHRVEAIANGADPTYLEEHVLMLLAGAK